MPRMPLSRELDDALLSTLMDLNMLWVHDVEASEMWQYKRRVGYAVGPLVDALEKPDTDDIWELARIAYREVSELSSFLEDVDSHDRRKRERIEMTREAVATLRTLIEPYTHRDA